MTAYKPKVNDLVLIAGRQDQGVGTVVRVVRRMGFPTAVVRLAAGCEFAVSYAQLLPLGQRIESIDAASTDELKETLSEVDTLCALATLASGSRVSLQRVRAWLTTELNRRNEQ